MELGSEASFSSAGRRCTRGRWNERRLCTRRAAADRACALGGALRSGPGSGSPEAGAAPSSGWGLGARGRTNRAGNEGSWAAAGRRLGDERPVSGVSEPVSPAGRQGVSKRLPASGGLRLSESLRASGACPDPELQPIWEWILKFILSHVSSEKPQMPSEDPPFLGGAECVPSSYRPLSLDHRTSEYSHLR